LGVILGSIDELAVLEHRAGADERDQMGGVHRAPAGLGGLDEFECDRQPGRA
jgi:integrase/recombinase XerD